MIVTLRSGEEATLLKNEDGCWHCPVCGTAELQTPPYFGNGAASFEMCSCGFEFGFDDDPGATKEALPTVTENWNRWRILLIKKLEHSADQTKQLKSNLAILGIKL